MDAKRGQTNFTFFLNDSDKLDNLVHRYWDINKPPETEVVNLDDKFARNTVANSLRFVDSQVTLLVCLASVPCPTITAGLYTSYKIRKRSC